jgi:DNA-binding transcriptional LysR family regulator
MTAAAAKLYMAQPSVSQAIAELEEFYNVKLFERLGRKLFITAAGQKLETYARHIVNLNKEAASAMREINNSGVLRIGASVTVGTCILNDILLEFKQDNGNIKIFSIVNNTKIIEGLLLQDQLDVGLVEGQIHEPCIVCEPFMKEELVLVCGRSHPLAANHRIQPQQLEGMVFFVREEGSGTRELFESVMNSEGVFWQAAGVCNNAETIKRSVAAGLGLSVMSKLAIRREVADHELVILPVAGISFKRQFCIAYHKNKFITPALQNIIQLCKKFKSPKETLIIGSTP